MASELLHILFGSERGGCEANSLNIIQALTHTSHRVAVLGRPGPMCKTWRSAGAEVEVLGVRTQSGRAAAAAVQDICARQRPDAAMIWYGLVHLPQLIWALNPLEIPVAVHGGNPAHTMPRRIDLRYELLGKLYPPRGPLPTYVCCSQYVADSFESSRYLRWFPRQVVPNGVMLPPGALYETRAIAPGRPPVIGMVARLNSIKDQATLVRAMAIVRRQFADAELELVGDGDERGALERLVGDLGLSGAVRFAGDVADVYGRMTGWDLFAYATTEREGFGNAVAEAMMFGLPCVVTDVGPMREFAGNGDAVRLVTAADPAAMATAICDLIVDVDARAALSGAAKRHAMARFHPKVFAKRYAEILSLCTDANKH